MENEREKEPVMTEIMMQHGEDGIKEVKAGGTLKAERNETR